MKQYKRCFKETMDDLNFKQFISYLQDGAKDKKLIVPRFQFNGTDFWNTDARLYFKNVEAEIEDTYISFWPKDNNACILSSSNVKSIKIDYSSNLCIIRGKKGEMLILEF